MVQTLHSDMKVMMAPEVLLQRPASLQGLLQLLECPDPTSAIPYAVLHLLQCLTCRLKQALYLASDTDLCCCGELLPCCPVQV